MTARFFHPWVGDRYRTEGYHGKRLLLLGESHYLPAGGGLGASPEMTRQMILECLAGPGRGNGYSDRVFRLVTGSVGRISKEQRADFWQRIAFCNFIQTALTGSRVRPTEIMWAAGREPLLETIGELAPQAILVLGVEVARRLPAFPAGVSVLRVKHPSSFGFSRKEWVPKVRAFLDAAAV